MAVVSKPIDGLEWVRKACSTDTARPVLTSIFVPEDGSELAATDGHRLHVAQQSELKDQGGVAPGLWKSDRPVLISTGVEGTLKFPDYRNSSLFPDLPEEELAGFDIQDVSRVTKICKGLASIPAYDIFVAFPHGGATKWVFINPQYVHDALLGFHAGARFRMPKASSVPPVHVTAIHASVDPRSNRHAVLMPVRMQSSEGRPPFDLSQWCDAK